MIEFLPGDKKHPPRPNLPIFRHLTYREAHLFQIGIWPGVAVALLLNLDALFASLAVVALMHRYMQDKSQEESHQDALTGYLRDSWYMAMGGVFGAIFATILLLLL